jgi:hypothetical protein
MDSNPVTILHEPASAGVMEVVAVTPAGTQVPDVGLGLAWLVSRYGLPSVMTSRTRSDRSRASSRA